MDRSFICPNAASNTNLRCYVTDCSYCDPPKQNNQIFFNEEWNMKENYEQWYNKIEFLQDKVKLPSGETISKDPYITSQGFNVKAFNNMLKNVYDEKNVK